MLLNKTCNITNDGDKYIILNKSKYEICYINKFTTNLKLKYPKINTVVTTKEMVETYGTEMKDNESFHIYTLIRNRYQNIMEAKYKMDNEYKEYVNKSKYEKERLFENVIKKSMLLLLIVWLITGLSNQKILEIIFIKYQKRINDKLEKGNK